MKDRAHVVDRGEVCRRSGGESGKVCESRFRGWCLTGVSFKLPMRFLKARTGCVDGEVRPFNVSLSRNKTSVFCIGMWRQTKRLHASERGSDENGPVVDSSTKEATDG